MSSLTRRTLDYPRYLNVLLANHLAVGQWLTQEHAKGRQYRCGKIQQSCELVLNRTDWGATYRYHAPSLQLAAAFRGWQVTWTMNSKIAGVGRGLGCTIMVIIAACGQWQTADGGSVSEGNPKVQKRAAESQSLRSGAPNVYVAATAESGASISLPESCSTKMGSGANFIEGSYELKGKCNGGGVSPRIEYDPTESHFLSFTVDPEQSVAGTRDRAELAYVRRYFPFNKQLFIGFRLMIPEGTDPTEEAFYALQLWQCAGKPPIAGVRVQRGTSHTINFMTRSHDGGRSRAKFELVPGEWHEFVLYMIPGTADEALFDVFADGELLVQSRIPYGFDAADACGEKPNTYRYRVKFGIYKGGEPGKRFATNFDDLTIADRFESVAIPLGWNPDLISSD